MTERLLTARELGEKLGLKPGTVLDKWERGEIPGYKWGNAVRFDLAEVLELGRRPGAAGGEVRATPTGRPTVAVLFRTRATPDRGEDENA